MSAKEYDLWIAEYEIEPWGEVRSDYRAAMIAKTSLLPHYEEEFDLEDFIVKFGNAKPKEKQTPEQAFAMLKNYTMSMGGKVT
jgi:hypothetical protein